MNFQPKYYDYHYTIKLVLLINCICKIDFTITRNEREWVNLLSQNAFMKLKFQNHIMRRINPRGCSKNVDTSLYFE